MLLYIFVMVSLLWVLQRQWKMRRILALSRKLRNKYVALPIVGHGLMFLGTGEDRMKSFQKLGRAAIQSEHGMTSYWMGSHYTTMTCDPIIAEEVLRTSLDKTGLGEIARRLLGNGTIIAPLPIWRPRRKILASMFSTKILNCYVEIFAEHSMDMIKCLKSRAGSGTFSIWKNFASYTMDSICQTTFGFNVGAQKQSFHPFLAAFNESFRLLSARLLQPWLYSDFVYKLLPVYKEAERYRIIMHDFVDKIIKERKITFKNENILRNFNTNTQNYAQIANHPTFLDLLIKSSGGSEGYSDYEIREEILALMLAAIDTTAVATCFTSVMLSRHLSIQEKAYEEVREIFGDSKRLVTIEDLSRLKYIDAVIRETLRLYPPVPVFIRTSDQDIELSSGITLPTGSWTMVNVWALNRNPRYWGADAEEFNPDRFLNGSVNSRIANMGFSHGPRNCLGYKYAMMSMKVVITTLLRDYKVLPPSEMSSEDLKKPLRVEFSVMMKDVDNFKVRLENRV